MPRNDGIDRTVARNVNLTASQIANAQRHNEREKESYTNPDIVPERTSMNVHFKAPIAGYTEMFEQMKAEGLISTRGLKDDAKTYGELIFDVNSAYFYNHGGYEYAGQFYEAAYQAAVKIVGGEQYILSAVMHADERNRAMSEALGEDVYHYHLHVVYVPVVEKQILWSKRCKDKSLIGTVKETIMQVSSSKKWASTPALDENGNPMLTAKGKPILRKSYSVLQDDFFNVMLAAGYADVERGERGSTEEHLTVTQFKVAQESARLEALADKVESKEAILHRLEEKTKAQKTIQVSHAEIDQMGKKTLLGKVELTQQEATQLKQLAKNGITAGAEIADLKQQLKDAKKSARIWKQRYEELLERTKDFLAALAKTPELVQDFLRQILTERTQTKPKQERTPEKPR